MSEHASEPTVTTASPRRADRPAAGGCPFSGAAAGSVSRRRVLAGAAGLAALPVLAGVGGTAVAATPTPVPTPTPTVAPGAAAALAKLRKGRALKGAHGVGD